MAEQFEDPQGERSPPVGLVTVDNNGVIASDALAVHQLSESFTVNEIAGEGIVEVLCPVNAHSAGEVSDIVKKGIFIGLHNLQTRGAEAGGKPGCRHDPFRVCVFLKSWEWVERCCHVGSLPSINECING